MVHAVVVLGEGRAGRDGVGAVGEGGGGEAYEAGGEAVREAEGWVVGLGLVCGDFILKGEVRAGKIPSWMHAPR